METKQLSFLSIFPCLLLVFPLLSAELVFDSGGKSSSDPTGFEWQSLTRRNFSSQIRLHPYILLLVTVPWSGESRSLMREIKHLVSLNKENLGNLKLTVVYRNSEKMLADLLDANEGIKILYYQDSVQFKYNGRLRAQNILNSVSYTMSLKQEEGIPFKLLDSIDQIENFLQSTEKSVLLIELCGWSAKLARQRNNRNNNETEFPLSKQSENVHTVPDSLIKDAHDTVELLPMNDKIIEIEELSYGLEGAVTGFSLANQSFPEQTDNTEYDNGTACAQGQFRKFDSFYNKLESVAKEYFLPPERQRFGLLSDKSLLPYLGIDGVVENWLVMVRYSACPSCSVVVREGDHLRNLLLGYHPLVKELGTDGPNPEASFPVNRPSIVLFIDRSSELSVVREVSKSTLQVLRNFAWQNRKSVVPSRAVSYKQIERGSTDSDTSLSQKILKTKDNMAIMLSTGESEGGENSLVAILTKLIQKTKEKGKEKEKETKISLLAKDVGFELLSEDFEVRSNENVDHSLISDDGSNNGDKNEVLLKMERERLSPEINTEKDNVDSTDQVEEFALKSVHDSAVIRETDGSQEELPMNLEQESSGHEAGTKVDNSASIAMQSGVAEFNGDNVPFTGSFFFSDGGYQILESLTSQSKIPSLVLIDPISQNHYVFPEEAEINYSSLANFIEGFLNKSLTPFLLSDGSAVTSTKQFPRPPFINLDFRESDSVPRVRASSFCELVMGSDTCLFDKNGPHVDSESVMPGWSRDVLVLFSNSWCGFCQRMELVVREIHRAFTNFLILSKSKESEFNTLRIEDEKEQFPLIYLMDCTLNDCFPFVKEELYPKLLLFPAENKTAISYEGDASVINIFEFLEAFGNNFHSLINYRGILWTQPGEKKKRNPHNISPINPGQIYDKFSAPTIIDEIKEKSDKERTKPVIVGSTLSATDKLANTSPFGNSTILIISANPKEGFQGIIINKRINWDIFNDPKNETGNLKVAPVFYGGPVTVQGYPFVSLTRKPIEGFVQVIEGVYFGNFVATNMLIMRIKDGEEFANDFWFFFGYTGWGYKQLFDELSEGAWILSETPIDHLDWPQS